jgi:serine/threonine protein phosphatase 1
MEPYPRNDARLLVGYHWLHARIGGIETLRSYGVSVPEGARIYHVHAHARAAVPQSHLDFLEALAPHHEEQGLLFVHAGILPGLPLAAQSEDDKIWIRQEFLNDPRPHPWLVVHGHSHVKVPEHHGNRVNLDTGAAYGHRLTAAVFENSQAWVLTSEGRAPLTP